MIAAVARTIGRQVEELYRTTFRRIGELFWENPKHLLRFALRLAGAMIYTDPPALSSEATMPGESAPDRRRTPVLETVRTIIKSFFRGIVLVIATGIIGGIAIGSLAGAIGPVVRPLVESPALGILLTNILPFLLALLLAARNGASIAARLALLRPSGDPPRMEGDMLMLEGMPSLVAAPLLGGIFYLVIASCLIAGYLVGSARPITVRVITVDVVESMLAFLRDYIQALGSVADFARARQAGEIVRDGLLKSMLFGEIVAFTAAAFGIRSAERKLSDTAEYFDFTNAVWESGVTALAICGVLTFLLWTNL